MDDSSNDDGDLIATMMYMSAYSLLIERKVFSQGSPSLFLGFVLVTGSKALVSGCLLSLCLGQPHPRKGRGVDAVSVTMRSQWMLQGQQC